MPDHGGRRRSRPVLGAPPRSSGSCSVRWSPSRSSCCSAELRSGPGGVVVAIHNLDAAAAYADRLVVMDAGVVVADGAPRDVLTTVDLGAVFGVPIEVVVDAEGRTVVRPSRPSAPAPGIVPGAHR